LLGLAAQAADLRVETALVVVEKILAQRLDDLLPADDALRFGHQHLQHVVSCCDNAMALPPGGTRRRGPSSSIHVGAAAGSPRRRCKLPRVAASSSRSVCLGR
jgi:hypothetical protein